ncbi:MAG: response regulator [Chloroflexi bacterium]|nr:response regulator [Chloroflexota bacterium]
MPTKFELTHRRLDDGLTSPYCVCYINFVPVVIHAVHWGFALTEKARILIVEDDLDLAEMLNAYFRVQGYDVSTAAWGEDAVRVSKETAPDLVVLDIRLPDIDGYEVCRRIRTNRRTASIPVIFLTEKRDRVDKLAGLELGVVDYITKPFDIQELRLRVRNALRSAVQQPLTNPITNLAEGAMVDEQLQKLIFSENEWAILSIAIVGLENFRELYGFVASDDVLRAVSLMMNNAVREAGSTEDFIGHMEANEFIIISNKERVAGLRERIQIRLQQSMEYFYPLKDREKARQAMGENKLQLLIGQVLSTDGSFVDVNGLKTAVLNSRQLAPSAPNPDTV